MDTPNFQGNVVINCIGSEIPWTRIIEYKRFEFGKDVNGINLSKTSTSREYNSEWKLGDGPYYPVNDAKNSSLYFEYKKLVDAENKGIFSSGFGEYRYYDMDITIEAVLKMCNLLLK